MARKKKSEKKENVQVSQQSLSSGNFLSEHQKKQPLQKVNFSTEHQEKKSLQKETFSEKQEKKIEKEVEKKQQQKKKLQRAYTRTFGHDVQKSEDIKEEVKPVELLEERQSISFQENLYIAQESSTDDTKNDTYSQPIQKSSYKKTKTKKEKDLKVENNKEEKVESDGFSLKKETTEKEFKKETSGHNVQKFEEKVNGSESSFPKQQKRKSKNQNNKEKQVERESSSYNQEITRKEFKKETFGHNIQKFEENVKSSENIFPEKQKRKNGSQNNKGRQVENKTSSNEQQTPKKEFEEETFEHNIQKFEEDVNGLENTFSKKQKRKSENQNNKEQQVERESFSNPKEISKKDFKKETFGHNVQKFGEEVKVSQNAFSKKQKRESENQENKEQKVESETFFHKQETPEKEFKKETFGHDVQKSEETKKFSSSHNSNKKEKKKQYSKNAQKKAYQETKQTKEQKNKEETKAEEPKTENFKTEEQKSSDTTSNQKVDFQKEEHSFTETDTFVPNKKLQDLEKEVEIATEKLSKEKQKLWKKTYRLERVFDEEAGKAKYVLKSSLTERYPKENLKQYVIRGFVNEGKNVTHGKISEVEKENVGVEAAHKAEQVAETIYEYFFSRRARKRRLHRRIKKATKQKIKAETDFAYEKFLEENPEVRKKFLQKQFQKKRIKREYAKAYREKHILEKAKDVTTKTTQTIIFVAKKVQTIATRNVVMIGVIAVIAMALVLLTTLTTLSGAILGDIITITMASSYLSQPEEIDAVELFFTNLEMELQNEIDNIEQNNPGYDEYRYNLGAIGHDPFVLISYFSAVYEEFTFSEIDNQVNDLFEEMYHLILTPTTEIRTRTETITVTNPETGELTTTEIEVEYEVKILQVTLSVIPLESLVMTKMNNDQKELYQLYMETKGNLQQFASPLDLHWYYYISSYYGYRKNPVSGEQQLHRGLDIAVPEGTPVYAAHTGMVTTATYNNSYGNYVVITDEKGYTTKYAHLSYLNVSLGQEIEVGTQIGATGNTGSSSGSHLHLEVLYEGDYYNPLFYFDVGENTINGGTPGTGGGAGSVIPPSSYDDVTVQILMTEAERYLGMPYTFGGTPPSSFDCSAFVCWVFTNSGVHNLPRTTAQGIYDQCTPVPASEAKAGDIIFFTGTYNAGRPVTHVGIYCGNGTMIHCGDPIQYASINTSYWQSHFYAFGRLN